MNWNLETSTLRSQTLDALAPAVVAPPSQTPVKVATGTVTSSSGTSTFILVGGASASFHSVSIIPPSNANKIIAIRVGTNLINGSTVVAPALAIPLGYADGANSSSLATATTPSSTSDIILNSFESGGSLVITTASIVIPVGGGGYGYDYSLYYQ